jgi:hypothetical protein
VLDSHRDLRNGEENNSMRLSDVFVTVLLILCAGASHASDLEGIDRTLRKQPSYGSKDPRYCLLVFGPDAASRLPQGSDAVSGACRQGDVLSPRRARDEGE